MLCKLQRHSAVGGAPPQDLLQCIQVRAAGVLLGGHGLQLRAERPTIDGLRRTLHITNFSQFASWSRGIDCLADAPKLLTSSAGRFEPSGVLPHGHINSTVEM